MAGRELRQASQTERGLGLARGLGNLGSSPSPPRVAGNKVSDARADWGGNGRLGGLALGPAPQWGHLGWAAPVRAAASRNKGVDVS